MLCPGLVDLRVKTGEPGAEPKETLKSAARAAAAGGVTSIVVQPDTDPVIDDPSVVDFILRRARDIELVHVYPAGAATKGLGGKAHGRDRPDARGGLRLCHRRRPADRRLPGHAPPAGLRREPGHAGRPPPRRSVASRRRGRQRGRVRRPHGPGLRAGRPAETIMLERDLALVELTGATLAGGPDQRGAARWRVWRAPRPRACR